MLNVIEGGFKSGKTEYLISQFIKLLRKGVSLSEILFIHPSPDIIRNRIKKYLKCGYSEIHIDTITGFSKYFLRKYQDRLSFPGPGFRVISGLEEMLIVKRIIADSKLKNFVSAISSFIDLYKLNFYPAPVKIEKDYPELIRIFREYQRFLMSRNWLDLRDLVIYSIKFIEKNPGIIDELGFKYVFVDEAENLDYNSFILIEKFFKEADEVYVSLNTEGSIYLFRGSLGRRVKEFLDKYDKVVEKLGSNSPSPCIEFSTHLDEYLEVMYVLREIKKLLRKGVSASSIAVIVRDFDIRVKIIEDISCVFGIPVEVKAGVSVFKEPVLIQFISLLSLINQKNLNDSNRVFKALSTPCFWEEEYNSLFIRAEKEKLSFIDFLKRGNFQKANKFLRFLKEIREFSKTNRIVDIIYRIYRDTGFLDTCLKDINTSRIFSFFFDMVEKFSEIFPDAGIEEFVAGIEDIVEFYGRESYFDRTKNSIKVLTVHEAGSEDFDYVFLIGLNQGHFPREYKLDTFPYFDSDTRKRYSIKPEYSLMEHIEEEKRIFEKAITRGNRKVFITALSNRNETPSFFLEILNTKKESKHPEVFLPAKKEDIMDISEYEYFYAKNFSNFKKKDILDKFYIPEDFKFTYSNLEEYRRCPVRFYYSSILKIRFPAHWRKERGIIIHSVLMELHRKYKEGRFPDNIEEEIRGMVKKEFDRFGHLIFWERRHQENIVLKELLNYVRNYRDFYVVEVEKKVEFEYNGFNFSVKIDRLDRTSCGYKIIDYKTGTTYGKTARTFYTKFKGEKKDKDIQFTLYYLGLKEALGMDIEEFEIIFLKGGLNVFNIRVESVIGYLPHRIEDILNLCSEIKKGNFHTEAVPNCFRCIYSDICFLKR